MPTTSVTVTVRVTFETAVDPVDVDYATHVPEGTWRLSDLHSLAQDIVTDDLDIPRGWTSDGIDMFDATIVPSKLVEVQNA